MDYFNKEYEDHRQRMSKLVDTAAESLETLVNGGGEEFRNELVDRIGSMHRTLQQKFIGEIVVPIVRKMAERMKDHNYDARNQYACEVCGAMLAGLAEKFPFIADGSCNLPLI